MTGIPPNPPPSPEPRAPSLARHFEKDEFPRRCDHCPAPLVAGTRYRKVLGVLDTSDSFVGGETSFVEQSFELVFCHRCFERLSRWLQNPLSEIPPEGEPPAELDEAELEEELEKELFILGDGEEELGSSEARKLGSRKPDPDPELLGFHASSLPDDPELLGFPASSLPEDICCPYTSGHERDCPKWPKAPGHGPCLDPDKMLGASDQFGGSDYDEENMP